MKSLEKACRLAEASAQHTVTDNQIYQCGGLRATTLFVSISYLQECPAGTTTKATAATTAADCSVVLPGYRPLFDGKGQAIGAQPCPIGTFSSAGQQCDTCPEDLTTQQPKQTSEKDCLAPPGFGYYPNKVAAAANASNAFMLAVLNATNSSTVVSCPSGSYKAGWNRDACVSCGVGFLTEPVPATSPDHCYLPPGYGSKYIATSTAGTNTTVRQLVAVKCMNGTYGSDSRHYGLEPQPCQVSSSHLDAAGPVAVCAAPVESLMSQ